MKQIEIPGQGIVEFPDEMSDLQIEAAIKANSPSVSKTVGALRAGGEGAIIGLLDEAMHGLGALIATQTGKTDKDLAGAYKEIRNLYNKEQSQFAKENPALAIGSTIAGGLLTAPFTGGSAAMQAKALKSIMPIVKQGALLGAAGGAGFAPTAKEIPLGMTTGGLLGAATPIGLQGLMKGAKGLYGAGQWATGLPGRMMQGPEGAVRQAAGQQIAKAFERDITGLSKAAQQAQALGPEAVLADVGGENVRKLAQTVASLPGKSAQLAEKTLQTRMNRSVPRILTALKKTIGKDQSVFKTTKALMEKRSAEAGPLYKEAMKESVDPVMMTNLITDVADIVDSAKGTKIGGQLKGVMNSLVKKTGEPKISVKDLHWAKMDIDDKISSAFRTGNKTLASELLKVKNGLLNVMDGDPTNPSVYGQARKIFSDNSSILSSIDVGRKILSTNPEEMAATIQNMSKADMDGFLVGATEAIANAIKRTPEGGNAARRVASYAVREKLKQAFPSEEALDQFMKALDVEDTFAQLRNVTLRGSQTQPRISSEAVLAGSAITDAAQGRFVSVVMGKIAQFLNNYKHIPEPVRDEIGQMLLSDFSKTGQASQKLLSKLAKQQIRKDQISNLIADINATATPALVVGETGTIGR